MKLLVTGANGFIGRAILRQLPADFDVTAVVCTLPTSGNIGKAHYIAQDLAETLEVTRLPPQIDAVLHLAQSSQYRNFPGGIRDMTDINISGIVDLLEYARSAGCRQFINFSTGSVYAGNARDQTETANIRPNGAYPLTKYISEQLANLYQPFMSILNLRLFFPYGPGQHDMLIPNIINSVTNGDEITLQGEQGGLILCPILVTDVVKICVKCLNNKTQGTMNVAGEELLTLKKIAEEIGVVMNKAPIFRIDKTASPAAFNPSLKLMQKLLNGEHLTPFGEGIRTTINS